MDINVKLTDIEFLQKTIAKWKVSKRRKWQIVGENYHEGAHDILYREREMLDERGKLVPVHNLPNNKIVDNQFAIMVSQKTNYLFGKPFVVTAENDAYAEALKSVFNQDFMRLIKKLGEGALKGGIAWLHVYYNEQGELKFKQFKNYECLPFWEDDERTVLNALVRVYKKEDDFAEDNEDTEKVEVYTSEGVRHYVLKAGKLNIDPESPTEAYINVTDEYGTNMALNWEKLPIIPFRYNAEEIPLIRKVKSLQDALNLAHSNFSNAMEENSGGGGILVLKNYGGENLGEFRKNLLAFRAVKVISTQDMPGGGVDVLKIEVDSENYRTDIESKKVSLVENAMGFDAKDLKSSAPNQLDIKSKYSNIELDANDMETEFQLAFEALIWFIDMYFIHKQHVDFTTEDCAIEFNRDMLMNESEIIEDLAKSPDLSLETRLEQHPMVDDAQIEMERIKAERKEQEAVYPPFPREVEAIEEEV